MMIGIGGADYSRRYRLQPMPLVIGPITTITDASVQLYGPIRPTSITDVSVQL